MNRAAQLASPASASRDDSGAGPRPREARSLAGKLAERSRPRDFRRAFRDLLRHVGDGLLHGL